MRKEYRNLKAKVVAPKTKKGTTRMIEAPKGIKYYDLVKNWKKVKPHLGDPELKKVLARDMNKFTYGRRREKFKHGNVPGEHDKGCEWQNWDDYDYVVDEANGMLLHDVPDFWEYVCYGACHWLVNFNLRLAQLVEPARPWRILTSRRHSTVWDGDKLLFEFNWQAFDVPPAECFEAARRGGREVEVGASLQVHFCEHWRVEARRHDREQRRRFRSAGVARRDPAKAKDVVKRPSTRRKQKRSTG
jgi:hypothetical protein